LTRSEITPAGKANRKNGNAALVAINDRRNGEAPSSFISQVAEVSCAETQHPETRAVIHSPKKTLFFSASQRDALRCCLVAANGISDVRRPCSLPVAAKVELSAQFFHLPVQTHNESDTDQVEAASAAQIFNAAQNPYGLIIKIPAAARRIHYRRHKSVLAIDGDEAPR
jgi:hypothetical protein